MDIPERRRTDVAWLRRNIAINNDGHPMLETALRILANMKGDSK
jgi:hypothetical protein